MAAIQAAATPDPARSAPGAAAAIVRLEKIDPEAVRRAATLAAFAGPLGAKPDGTAMTSGKTQNGDQDGDPGDPSAGPAIRPQEAASATAQAMPADQAIAMRIPAVLADDEATDDTPGIDPSRPAAARLPSAAPGIPATPAGGRAKLVKWTVWTVIVLVIGLFSRAALRVGGSGPSAR